MTVWSNIYDYGALGSLLYESGLTSMTGIVAGSTV